MSDTVHHSLLLEALSSFGFWDLMFSRCSSNLTGCSFSVSFADSSPLPPSHLLNIGVLGGQVLRLIPLAMSSGFMASKTIYMLNIPKLCLQLRPFSRIWTHSPLSISMFSGHLLTLNPDLPFQVHLCPPCPQSVLRRLARVLL